MKYRYTKFTGDLLDEIDLEDLVSKLSDLLLSSGFGNPYGTDERGYAAAEPAPRRATRREEAALDEEIRMPAGKKKYYN